VDRKTLAQGGLEVISKKDLKESNHPEMKKKMLQRG